MRTVLEYDELRVPDYALPLLVNGDASGLEADDVRAVENWFAFYVKEAAEIGGTALFVPGPAEASFTWRPAFGKACNCVFDCVVAILKEETR
jgi:hypothetical protein